MQIKIFFSILLLLTITSCVKSEYIDFQNKKIEDIEKDFDDYKKESKEDIDKLNLKIEKLNDKIDAFMIKESKKK